MTGRPYIEVTTCAACLRPRTATPDLVKLRPNFCLCLDCIGEAHDFAVEQLAPLGLDPFAQPQQVPA